MTAAEAIEYIEKGIWSTTRLGLERTYELLDLLDNPQKKLKFIHVAGSNGKGSTCAMPSPARQITSSRSSCLSIFIVFPL